MFSKNTCLHILWLAVVLTCPILADKPAPKDVMEISGFARWDEARMPSEVRLAKQLSAERKEQNGGSCHVYAATSLVESACYRYTGKHVRISEPYMFYRHLRNRFKDQKPWGHREGDDVTKDDGGWAQDSIRRIFEESVCTEAEVGDKYKFIDFIRSEVTRVENSFTAERKSHQAAIDQDLETEQAGDPQPTGPANQTGPILGGAVGGTMGLAFIPLVNFMLEDFSGKRSASSEQACLWRRVASGIGSLAVRLAPVGLLATGGTFIGNQVTLQQNVKDWDARKKKRKSEFDDKKTGAESDAENTWLKSFLAAIDERATSEFGLDHQASGNGGPYRSTKDKDLRDCLNHGLSTVQVKKPTTKQIVQLMALGLPVTCSADWTFPNGTHGPHVAIITGYRVATGFTDNVEFQAQNADGSSPSWGWSLGCKSITVIFDGSERAKVYGIID